MSTQRLPKMMIGFVVRRCAVALGRMPTPAEFAAWANSDSADRAHRFGRPISEEEARLILRHQSRLVTARDANAEEAWADADEPAPTRGDNVIRLADLRARRARN